MIDGTELEFNGQVLEIELTEAVGSASEYLADTQRIGYGSTGFETFTFDVPDRFRGKTATLRFEASGDTVYLDNVFFKSQHLLLGNPTEARTTDTASNQYFNNYLLEKPQYSVSFSGDDHIPNWSAWQLNNSWFGTQEASRDFRRDPKLDQLGIISAKGSDYYGSQATINPGPTDSAGNFYKFEPGHLAAYSDRKRSTKDNAATNLTSNIVPQQSEHNSPLWSGLEEFSRKLVTNQGKEVYVYAGSVGEKNPAIDKANIQISGDPSYGTYGVHVPDFLWKVLVILDRPGLGVQEIGSSNATAFAVWTQNSLPAASPPGSSPIYIRWNEGGMEIITVAELEARLNRDPSNLARGIRYDFFPTLSDTVRNSLKTTAVSIPSGSNPSSAFLLAEIDGSNDSTENTAIRHNSSTESTTSETVWSDFNFGVGQISVSQVGTQYSSESKTGISQVGTSQICPDKISVSEISSSQVSILQIGISQAGLPQLSSTQVGPTQITFSHEDLAERGITEINSSQIDAGQLIGRFNTQVGEVSLSSSIPLQQFFNIHNYTLKNTTVPAWLEFLQGTTPFNLNIEITDLPTGQLAEANITGFDPTGRPNSGTLYLDTDANGLGWYIDPTPWDNTEYSQTLTDTAYRATADSLAYGHYDLLTTILHETSHLQGFIAGYSNYDSHIQTQNGSKTFVGRRLQRQISSASL